MTEQEIKIWQETLDVMRVKMHHALNQYAHLSADRFQKLLLAYKGVAEAHVQLMGFCNDVN